MDYFQDKKFLDTLYGQQDHIAFRGNFLKTYSNRKYSIRDIALQFFDNPRGKRILDIGAGTGSFLRKIMESYPNNLFAALDIAESTECRNLPNLDYRIFDGGNFPNDLGKWDIIILMHMLYHVPNHKQFLDKVRLLLNKNGRVLITTKSRATLPELEAIFQKIITSHFPTTAIPAHRDEAHFCSENGLEILENSFGVDTFEIEDYPIETQVIVDKPDDVVRYVLSTPRYNPQTYNLTVSGKEYAGLWRSALDGRRLYIDNVKEILYVITEKSRL